MDINFKDILQKLSVFKNNTALLVPIIVAVVAILLFVPTYLLGSKLKTQVQTESITKTGTRVISLGKSDIAPVQPESLAALMETRANDANQIEDLARETTMRDLLSYEIFPEIDVNNFSGLMFVEFGNKYRAGIEELIRKVNGRDCPTDVEIQQGLESSSALTNRRRGMYGMGDPYGMGAGPMGRGGPMPRRLGTVPGMAGPRTEIDRMIVDQMCTERAASASVYVNPTDIPGYTHWGDTKYDVNMVPAVKDAWYHQLAYWVIKDVFDTIAATNAGHDSLLNAPVKRLRNLSFTMGLKRPGSRGKKSKAVIRAIGGRRTKSKDADESDRPAYVITDKDGLTESLTGRHSEGAIDVIHFNLTVVVSSEDTLLFLQELCNEKTHQFHGYPGGARPAQTFVHNQITVLESKMSPVNPDDMLHYYYRYGDGTPVELDLICEYIFNKAGYEPIKPQVIKDELAAPAETSGL